MRLRPESLPVNITEYIEEKFIRKKRAYRFPIPKELEGKTLEDITENEVLTLLLNLISSMPWSSNIWWVSKVNLWRLAEKTMGRRVRPSDILREYKHPLQPDIDFLYGPKVNDRRSAPLVGVEVKVFSEARYAGVIPKTRLGDIEGVGTGYYAGLDEAIAMLTFGLDYVYLWHFIILPWEKWEKYLEYGKDFSKKLLREHTYFSGLYAALMKWLLGLTAIPLGYLAFGVSFNKKQEYASLFPYHTKRLSPKTAPPNPLKNSPSALKIRELLMKSLDVEEQSGSYLKA